MEGLLEASGSMDAPGGCVHHLCSSDDQDTIQEAALNLLDSGHAAPLVLMAWSAFQVGPSGRRSVAQPLCESVCVSRTSDALRLGPLQLDGHRR